MGSIVSVDTLQGLTSGQVTLPTGHKIKGTDVGSVCAPGQIIKVEHSVQSTSYSTSATSSSIILSQTFIPSRAGSKLLVIGVVPRYRTANNTGAWASSAYVDLLQDSSVVAGFEHPGPLTVPSENSDVIHIQYMTSALTIGQSYVFSIRHIPTASGTNTWTFGRTTNGAPSYTRMTIMEIAQ